MVRSTEDSIQVHSRTMTLYGGCRVVIGTSHLSEARHGSSAPVEVWVHQFTVVGLRKHAIYSLVLLASASMFLMCVLLALTVLMLR